MDVVRAGDGVVVSHARGRACQPSREVERRDAHTDAADSWIGSWTRAVCTPMLLCLAGGAQVDRRVCT